MCEEEGVVRSACVCVQTGEYMMELLRRSSGDAVAGALLLGVFTCSICLCGVLDAERCLSLSLTVGSGGSAGWETDG